MQINHFLLSFFINDKFFVFLADEKDSVLLLLLVSCMKAKQKVVQTGKKAKKINPESDKVRAKRLEEEKAFLEIVQVIDLSK